MQKLIAMSVIGLSVALMTSLSAQSSLVTFTIDDNFPETDGPGVFSDAVTTGVTSYGDYRINTADYLNWCVDAEPFSAGNLFVRLNRKLDGDSGTLRCSENPRPDGALGVPRQYIARIANDAACDILADPLAGLPLVDGAGDPWDVNLSATPCVLPRSDNPRIRLGTLYKPKARSTTVDFLVSMFDFPHSYEIRSVSAAAIAPNPLVPGLTTVEYSGTFQLMKFEPGVKARAVGPRFSMPVEMEFLR